MNAEPRCRHCDTGLVDVDMAEDFDDPSIRWAVGRCPNDGCREDESFTVADVVRALS